MALDIIADRLQGQELFRGLATHQIERLAREADRLLVRKGQPLVTAGAEAEGAILLISGSATALSEPSLGFVETAVEAGSLLGEAALLAEHRHNLTVIAASDVRAVRIRRETLLEHLRDDADLAAHLHDRLAARLAKVALELRLIDEQLAAALERPGLATG